MNSSLLSAPRGFPLSSSMILVKPVRTARKKLHSQYRITHNRTESHIPCQQPIPHSKVLEICSNREFGETATEKIKRENKMLLEIMKQMNADLTLKLERRRVYNNSVRSVTSVKEILNEPPKDLQGQLMRNRVVKEGLVKELQFQVKRMRTIEQIDYRIRIEEEIKRVEEEIKKRQEKMRVMKRKEIGKQRTIETRAKGNPAEDVVRLRREIIKFTQHGAEFRGIAEEVERKNQKVLERIRELGRKEEQLQGQLQGGDEIDQIYCSNKEVIEANEVYISNLNRLQKWKHRYQTSEDINKVKYYNCLKKLEGHVARDYQLDQQIRELQKEIEAKKEMTEEMSVSVSMDMRLRNKSMLEARYKEQMIITEVPEDMKGSGLGEGEKGRENLIELRKTVQSEKLLKEVSVAQS